MYVVRNRHGVRQLRTGWADGPAYITQCPIGTGKTYMYNFTVTDQRGTLLWHAHYSWQRASVYGAFIIYPRMPPPFSAPVQDHIPIIFGNHLFFSSSHFGILTNTCCAPFFHRLCKVMMSKWLIN